MSVEVAELTASVPFAGAIALGSGKFAGRAITGTVAAVRGGEPHRERAPFLRRALHLFGRLCRRAAILLREFLSLRPAGEIHAHSRDHDAFPIAERIASTGPARDLDR